jgi:hypothetical protein
LLGFGANERLEGEWREERVVAGKRVASGSGSGRGVEARETARAIEELRRRGERRGSI